MKKTLQRLVIVSLLLALIAGILWAADDSSVSLVFGHKPRRRGTVWDCVVTGAWDVDDTGAVTQAITVNGIIQKLVFVVPNTTNNRAMTLVILDNENETIFSSGSQAENATYTFSLHEPVTGTIDVVLTMLTGITGDAGSIEASVVLRGI